MTNAEARFNKSLHPRKPEGSLGWTAQDVHLDSHTAPELCEKRFLIDDHLYSTILCSPEQTHCTCVWFCMRLALWCFCFCFFSISTEVVYLQCWHGWCHRKLQPSWRKSCVHHTTIHHVTSCKATYIRCMHV